MPPRALANKNPLPVKYAFSSEEMTSELKIAARIPTLRRRKSMTAMCYVIVKVNESFAR